MNATPPVVHGLVLAGGASRRMGRDKAALEYHGRPQLHWAFERLRAVCATTYVSVRADQRDEPARAGLPQLLDLHSDIGPLAGIVAAQARHPDAAWLVLACDLPFLDEKTLGFLLEQRDPSADATAFRSSHDGLPEPLCAIYEPHTRAELARRAESGPHCPRKYLIQSRTRLLDLPSLSALDNVNTPDEHEDALGRLAS
jgi:molybdopterin-guanine dinucleotide biosynthesis protein A